MSVNITVLFVEESVEHGIGWAHVQDTPEATREDETKGAGFPGRLCQEPVSSEGLLRS